MTSPGRVIGLDVGGTKVAIGWIEDGGFTLGEEQPTRTGEGPDGLLDQIASMVDTAGGGRPVGVGLGIPSVIEYATGRVKSSVNVPLRDVPVRRVLHERLGLPVFVDNDANVAALAEAHDGERFRVQDLVMVTVGTGVGGGLVLGGRVFRGATGAAGELGHQVIALEPPDGPPEPGPRPPYRGSLETTAAGTALDRLAREAVAHAPDSALARAAGGAATGRQVVELALEGDELAVGLLTRLGERLGIGIANMINVFDPEEVVIGGGVARAGELLLGPARETAHRFVLPGVGEGTEIRLARRGAGAGVWGAALLAQLELGS